MTEDQRKELRRIQRFFGCSECKFSDKEKLKKAEPACTFSGTLEIDGQFCLSKVTEK
jgi:hypothetical protein